MMAVRKNFYVLLVCGFTLLGCLYQVYEVCDKFLRYKTTTLVVICQSVNITPPAVAVCMTTDFPTDDSNVTLFFKEIIQPDRYPVFILHSFWHTGSYLMVVRNNQEAQKQISIKYFMKWDYKCIIMKYRSPVLSRSQMLDSDEMMIYQVFYNRFRHSPREFFKYFLIPNETNYLQGEDSFDMRSELVLESISPNGSAVGYYTPTYPCLSYQRRVSHTLSSPYDTDCRDYHVHGFESSHNCFEVCYRSKSEGLHNRVPSEVTISEATSVPRIGRKDRADSRLMQDLAKLRDECRTLCHRTECRKETFTPTNTCPGSLLSKSYKSSGSIALVAPNAPDVITTSVPKITLIETITMALNCISFWLAFCPLTSLNHDKVIKVLFKADSAKCKMSPVLDIQAQEARQKEINWRRVYQIGIAVVCVACCGWQIFEAAQLFFKYPTVSKVYIRKEQPIRLPAITFCSIGSRSALYENIKSTANESMKVIFGTDFAPDQGIESLDSLAGGRYKAEYFIKFNYACFTAKPIDDVVHDHDASNSTLLRLISKNTTREYMKRSIYLHNNVKRMYGQFGSFQESFIGKEQQQFTMTYAKFESKRLPAPYATNCFDYEGETKFESQDHCLEACIINTWIKKYNSFPSISTAYESLNMRFSVIPQLGDQESNYTKHRVVHDACIPSCSKSDCESTSFTIQAIDATVSHIADRFVLTVMSPSDPITISVTIPVVIVIDYLTNSLGILSYWLAICPLTLFMHERIISGIVTKVPSWTLKHAYTGIVFVICLLGYAYQVFLISSSYFEYKTTNTLMIVRENVISVPAIDFCHPIFSYEEIHTPDPTTLIARLVTRHAYIDMSQIVNLHDLDEKKKKLRKEVSLTSYVMFNMMCHTFNLKHDLIEHSTLMLSTPGLDSYQLLLLQLFRIKGNSTAKMNYRILLHQKSVTAFDRETNVQSFRKFAPGMIASYRTIGHTRLRKPYENACQDYEEDAVFKSSPECFDSCYRRDFLNAYNKEPYDAPQYVSNSRTINQTEWKAGKEVNEMKQKCRSICGKDCRQETYLLNVRQFEVTLHPSITLYAPYMPTFTITTSAQTTLLEFVIFLFTGASFWFAFCPLSLLLSRKILYRFDSSVHAANSHAIYTT